MATARVVILGGGFAGMAAARALRHAVRAGRCDLTLVDREPVSAMIPVLPDYAAGLLADGVITAPLAGRLPTGAAFLQDTVSAVDPDARTVAMASGKTIPYDYLVLAMGSVAAPGPDGQATDDVYTLTTYADACRLRTAYSRWLESSDRPAVLISGAGYTGIELAVGMVRSAIRQGKRVAVTLVEQREAILPFLGPAQQARVRRCLDRHGITLRTGCKVARFDGSTAVLSDGTATGPVLFCRAEGTVAPVRPAGDQAALGDGRLRVTPVLSLPAHPAVFAAGDAAAIPSGDGFLRKAVNFSIYTGHRAGANVARLLRGASPRPFRSVDLGWVIPMGDDSVGRAFGRVPLYGRPGLRLHYVMCGVRNYTFRNLLYFVRHAAGAGRPVNAKGTV